MKIQRIAAAAGHHMHWLIALCLTSIWITPGIAQTYRNTNQPVIIQNDPGGNLQDRLLDIQRLEKRKQPVEIRGTYCMSACTMYLGLANTCIDRNTLFGFHGPSSGIYGVGLAPAEFEKWSMTMANHYPAPLRKWYLETGRNITVGFYKIRGRNLIKMGIAECS